MENSLEFIIEAINKVSKTNRVEGLKDSKIISIEGTKKGFLKNEIIQIFIKRTTSANSDDLFVTAIVNGKSESKDISKKIMYDILKREGMLDNKLEMKLDILLNIRTLKPEEIVDNRDLYHSKLKTQDAGLKVEYLNPYAEGVVIGYRLHLEKSWPEIKNFVEIGFIEGTNGTEIGISNTLGWKDEDWISFLRIGLALPIALENCKKYGILRLVLYCNDEILGYTPDELRELVG